jgi:hypothetical protein
VVVSKQALLNDDRDKPMAVIGPVNPCISRAYKLW